MKIGLGRKSGAKSGMELLNYQDLWNLVMNVKVNEKTLKTGDGTYGHPYSPVGINEWYWLSKKTFGKGHMFITVGGRLIARWGKSAGYLKGYSSDVTNLDPKLFTLKGQKPSEKAKKWAETEDGKRNLDPDQTVYTRKAQRVLNADAAASNARKILSNIGAQSEAELANTMVGLLTCESSPDRSRSGHSAIFLATFMLLDLIEKQIHYGQNHDKFYTWHSMLMHKQTDSQGITVKPVPKKIKGRGSDSQGPTGVTTVAKHPMVGQGTVDMGKKIDERGQNADETNMARNRIASIASVWLANYLAEQPDSTNNKWTYYLLRQDDTKFRLSSKRWRSPQIKFKSHKSLKDECKRSLHLRAQSASCLLKGTKSKDIEYCDNAGVQL